MMFSRKVFLLSKAAKYFSTEANVIFSKAKQLQIPKITLHEYLWKNFDKWPDRTATICFETNRSYTYHELYKKSLSVTKFLKDSVKLKKHDTVAVVLPNLPEYPIIFIGAIQAGLKVTTCNPNYTANEIQKQFQSSNPQLVFTSKELLPVVRQAVANLPIVEVTNGQDLSNGTISFKEISSGEGCQPVTMDINETVLLLYSSGTTGLPKGVQLSHFNQVANLSQITSPEINLFQTENQDVIPAFLPFFHIYGLTGVLLHGLTMGAKIVCIPKYTTNNFIQALKKYKPTLVFGVPLNVIMTNNNPNITSEDLASIRTFMCGAAPLGASDIEKFLSKTNNHKVNLLQSYGMTETSPVVLSQTKKIANGIKIGGSGFLIPNTSAKIIPLDGSTTALGPNDSGELLIRGPQVMKGYLNNTQANEEILLDGGWIRTGDIAYYDEDEHFFITDRLKELIKVKGFQVAPAELEEILRTHPGVEDVAVVGIPHPVLGEAPKAFVVPKSHQTVKTSQIEEFVAAKVAKQKRLVGGVVFVDTIPKSASGKILRRELKKFNQ